MAKGYWIGHVDISDADGYKAYQAANAVAFRKYGGRFLVRAGASEQPEGKLRSRHVVIEFKDYPTALACYRSPEYAAAIEKRKGKGKLDLAIVEGYEGAQASRMICLSILQLLAMIALAAAAGALIVELLVR